MKTKLKALTKSRRFWAAITGVVTVLLEELTGLSPVQAGEIILILSAWIVGDSLNKTEEK